MNKRGAGIAVFVVFALCGRAASAVVLNESFNCPFDSVVGPVTVLASAFNDTINLNPNAVTLTELPTNQLTRVDNPAAANGTYTGTLSCTYTLGGVTVPFTRSLSLVVTNATNGIMTVGATAFSVNLGPTGIVSVSAPAETTTGFSRNLVAGGIIIVPLALDVTVILQTPIPMPLADWLPAALSALILGAIAWRRRRSAGAVGRG